MKKVLSLILALAMLLGCSLMVFAAVNAEMCEFCEDGTVVWLIEEWTMIAGTFDPYKFCDEHHCDAATWTEHRVYGCRDCGEPAIEYYRDAFHCWGPDIITYSNYQEFLY